MEENVRSLVCSSEPDRLPLISDLQTGVLSYNEDGTTFQLHVSGGFVEGSDDKVSVLAEIAKRPEEIGAARVCRASRARSN